MVKLGIINLVSILPRVLNLIVRRYELKRARHMGMRVGKNTRFVGSHYFGTEPYLITIGQNCLITDRVTFVTHDGGIQVPFVRDGLLPTDVYGRKSIFGSVTVGDNCFIGIGAILLPDTEIGANSIIGAGSIVRGKFEMGSVIAGNPARQISTLEQYFEKNVDRVIEFTGLEAADIRTQIIMKNAV